jgi:SPP1 gp7 family putative phage head morphogenesis protein
MGKNLIRGAGETTLANKKTKASDVDATTKSVNVPQVVAFGDRQSPSQRVRVPTDAQLVAAYNLSDAASTPIDHKAQCVADSAVNGVHLYRIGGAKNGLKSKRVSLAKKKQLREVSRKFRQSGSTEVEEILDHPILDLFYRPNAAMTGHDASYVESVQVDVLGRSANRKYRGDDRVNVNAAYDLYPLEPQALRAKAYDQFGNVTQWEYRVGRVGETYEAADVVVKGKPSIAALYSGHKSALASVYPSVELALKLTQYQNSILDNKGEIKGFFVNEDGWTDETQQARFAKQINKKFVGLGKSDYGYLDGKVRFIETSYKPTDLAPLEVSRDAERKVSNAVGYPEALLSKDATYSNLEGSRSQLASNAIKPALTRRADFWNECIIPDFEDGDSLFIAFDDPTPENKEQKLKALDLAAKYSSAKKNELRAAAGLTQEPEEVGDVFATPAVATAVPAADADPEAAPSPSSSSPVAAGLDQAVGSEQVVQTTEAAVLNGAQITAALSIVTQVVAGQLPRDSGVGMLQALFNLTPEVAEQIMGSAGTAAPTTPNPLPKEAASDLTALNDRVAAGKLARAIAINIAAKVYGDEAKNLIGYPAKEACGCGSCDAATVKAAKPAQQQLADKLKSIFAKQRAQVLAKVKAFDPDEVTTKGLPDKFVELDDWDEEIAHEVKPVVELLAAEQGQKTLTRVGASPDVFAVMPAKLEPAVERATLRFAQSTNQTTTQDLNDALEKLRGEIRDGLVQGDSVREMTKRVNDVFDNAETYRAERIAQTEVSRAVHTGQKIAAVESGLVKGFKLLLSDDACPICQELDGKEIGLNDKFNEGDDYDDSPLPVHPNCRCSMTELL